MKIKLPEFATKSELFDYLIANKSEIVELKKSAFKECDDFGSTEMEHRIVKSINKDAFSTDTDSQINRSIVGNTYLWLDSHDDVHMPGVFAESIKHRGANRIGHLHDHIQQLDAKVGQFSNVYEKDFDWVDLGVNKVGSTQALVGDSTIKKSLNATIFDQYKNGEIDQHSVGMFYTDLRLAINDPERKAEYAEWVKTIDKIGNKEKAIEQGYFWPVYGAKLREISCVLAGSNEITPTLSPSGDSKSEKDNHKNIPAGEQDEPINKNYLHFI